MRDILNWIKKAPVTTALVVINVIVFIVIEILGDSQDGYFMIRMGAMSPKVVLYNGQWYRLLTAMFLHFGGEHILNNMFLLLVLGQYFERAVGSVKYTAIYLGSGIAASFVSMFHMLLVSENNISAGASGAVFGIIGGLVMVVLVHKGKYAGLSTRKMLILAALSLYAGFSTQGVDNFNHLGGIVTGFILTFFIYGIPYLLRQKSKDKIPERN